MIPWVLSLSFPQGVTPFPGHLQTSLDPSDPALNFFSEHFDALKALYTKGLQPPVPKMKPLDNVVKCRLILPPELPDSWSAWNAAHPRTESSEVPQDPPPPPPPSSALPYTVSITAAHPNTAPSGMISGPYLWCYALMIVLHPLCHKPILSNYSYHVAPPSLFHSCPACAPALMQGVVASHCMHWVTAQHIRQCMDTAACTVTVAWWLSAKIQ